MEIARANPGRWIFLLALVLRLAYVLVVPEPPLSPNATGAFIGGAERLLDGRGFSDPTYPMFSPPLVAMTIAASYSLLGRHTLPIRLLQAGVDATTVLLVYLIARRLFGQRAGIAAGLLAAVYPFSIYEVQYIGTETLFSFGLVAFVWLTIDAVTTNRLATYAAAGLVLGVTSLVRGSTQFYPAALAASLFLVGRRDGSAVLRWAVASLCFAAVIAPWTMRNWRVLHAFIPLATSASPMLCGSTEEFFEIPGRDERQERYFDELEAKYGWKRPPVGAWVEWEHFYRQAALEKYRERYEQGGVLSIAGLFAKRFTRLWYTTESGTKHALLFTLNAPIYLLGVTGAILAWRRRVVLAWLPVMPIVYLAALHTAVYAYFRYIVPAMPLFLCFAGVGLVFYLERIGWLRATEPRTATTGVPA